MPWVKIGDCGHSTKPGETFEFELGIEYLKRVCGEVPEGCELGVMWGEFDGGKDGEILDLPSGVGLAWDDNVIEAAPWDYLNRCEKALKTFDESVNWSAIHPDAINKLPRKGSSSRRRRKRQSRSQRIRSRRVAVKDASPISPPVPVVPLMGSATEVLSRVRVLQQRNAQWDEILSELNPTANSRIKELLIEIRGPHMFVPHLGLGVIADGCKRSLASSPEADALAALREAIRLQDPFVRD